MKAFYLFLIRCLLWPFIIIPYPFYKGFGTFITFILYRVLGYRKKVVFQNLQHAFPEYSDNQIQKIAKDYYVFLGDVISESFKTMAFSKSEAIKHCHVSPEAIKIFNHYFDQKKSVLAVMGHIGNWEWGSFAFTLSSPQPMYVLYHPLSNAVFEKLMLDVRSRFGSRMIPMQDTLRMMLSTRQETSLTIFISDQTPPPQTAYWTTFLNQDTPVFTGIEKIARRFNYPIVYAVIKRVKRGYYVIEAETLFEEPALTKENEITEAHTRRLEKDIINDPATWLWSHRRWKHTRPN